MYQQKTSNRLVLRKKKKGLSKKTNRNNMNTNNTNSKKIKKVCYSGTGSKKTMHSVKEFLKIMEKDGKKEACAKYKKSLKCTPCKKRKKLLSKINRKRKLNSNYKPSNKLMDKEEHLFDKCLACQDNYDELCNLKKYIEWSGANPNKC
jgi:hypothetical protein